MPPYTKMESTACTLWIHTIGEVDLLVNCTTRTEALEITNTIVTALETEDDVRWEGPDYDKIVEKDSDGNYICKLDGEVGLLFISSLQLILLPRRAVPSKDIYDAIAYVFPKDAVKISITGQDVATYFNKPRNSLVKRKEPYCLVHGSLDVIPDVEEEAEEAEVEIFNAIEESNYIGAEGEAVEIVDVIGVEFDEEEIHDEEFHAWSKEQGLEL